MPFHGSGHDLKCGTNRGVGDQPGGVLRVGLRRYRRRDQNRHQPLPRPNHEGPWHAGVTLHDDGTLSADPQSVGAGVYST